MTQNKIERLVLILIVCSLTQQAIAQATWDEKNARYTDHNYHFSWILPTEYEWEKQISIESHTVFTVESSHGLAAHVNITPFSEDFVAPDVWDDFDFYRVYCEYISELLEDETGQVTTILQMDKVKFAVPKAIKLITKITIEDDTKTLSLYELKYLFIRNNALWQVGVGCSPDVYKDLGVGGLTRIFSGFSLNVAPRK